MGEAKRRRDRGEMPLTGVERTDVKVGAENCPHCGEKMSTLLTVDRRGDAVPMQPRSVIICHHCTGVGWVNEAGKLVKFDESIIRRMDPGDAANIVLAVSELRRRKAARGEGPGGGT